MFRAVRTWWLDGRGKPVARLFLFEFVVVVAGVLVAQGLANWVSDRAAERQMEATRTRVLRELSDNLAYAKAWKAAIPCLDQRMVVIMREAAGGPVSGRLVERPRFPNFIQGELDDRSELLMRKRYGDRSADLVTVMRSDFDMATARASDIITAWGRLSLADPALGEVSPDDRAAVRAAAADIRANLRSVHNLLNHIANIAAAERIPARSADRFRAAANCREVWHHRDMVFPA